MKTAITGLTLIIITILSLGINISIAEKDIRQDEIELATNNAIHQTITNAKIKEMYEIGSENEMISEFNRTLLTQITSDSTITIKIIGINYEAGMMDIEVAGEFEYFTGVKDKVTVRKSIIFDGSKIEGKK